MSLPESVRVKVSSEGVESIGITPVVVQEMPLEELVRLMLGLTGKDSARIRELLLRGTLVSGASRFRWQGFEADAAELDSYLTRYPSADPNRRFDPAQCFQVLLRTSFKALTIEREAGQKRRMFRHRSFWDELMALASTPQYIDYSYRERADIFRLTVTPDVLRALQESASLLAYSSYENHVRGGGIQHIDLFVRR